MNVVVYSQANCPGCSALKMQLKSMKVEFQEVRIDLDAGQKAFILGEGHRSVPVMYVNGVHMTLQQLKEKL